jgi:hypothetical protein
MTREQAAKELISIVQALKSQVPGEDSGLDMTIDDLEEVVKGLENLFEEECE